ncbi:MAG: hypothetical protein ACK4SS_08310, partial [Cypionkella sp.]
AEGLTLSSTDYAASAQDNDPIASYGAFRSAADALQLGDFAEAVILEDGGVVVLEMLAEVPPTPRPFAEVTDQLTESLRAKALADMLQAVAEDKLAQANAGADFASLGAVQTASGITRDGAVPSAPQALIAAAFAADVNAPQIIREGDFTALLRVSAITPASANAAANDLAQSLEIQLGQSIAADIFDLYGRQIEATAGISIDQGVISSIHSQLGN